MTMRLTVLGGAAAWPNPGQGCSSYLIEANDTTLVLDCGPDTLSTLRARVDYHDVDALIVSHWHSDHVLDLVPYRYGLVYGPGVAGNPVALWVPPTISRRLDALAASLIDPEDDPRAFWSGAFDVREYDPDAALTIGQFDISFTQTQHYVPCYAARVVDKRSGSVVAYSADTGSIEPLVELFRGADVAIVEATLDDHGDTPAQERGHLTPTDAGRLARIAGAKTLLVTHLWSERDPAVVISQASAEFDGPVITAEVGMTIDV